MNIAAVSYSRDIHEADQQCNDFFGQGSRSTLTPESSVVLSVDLIFCTTCRAGDVDGCVVNPVVYADE